MVVSIGKAVQELQNSDALAQNYMDEGASPVTKEIATNLATKSTHTSTQNLDMWTSLNTSLFSDEAQLAKLKRRGRPGGKKRPGGQKKPPRGPGRQPGPKPPQGPHHPPRGHHARHHHHAHPHYRHGHHYNYYWGHRASIRFYPPIRWWTSPVVIVAPTHSHPHYSYEGPDMNVDSIKSLSEAKHAVDQLKYDLHSLDTRNVDDARKFTLMAQDVIDSYHYILYQVFDYASEHKKGVVQDEYYQEIVKDIWRSSLDVLNTFESKFPGDSWLRFETVNSLHRALNGTKVVDNERWADRNPFYRNLTRRISHETIN